MTLQLQVKYQHSNQNLQIEGETTPLPYEKDQTTIYKTVHRKLKIEQHEHHQAKHRG